MKEAQIKAREIVIKMQFQKEPIMFEQAKHCTKVAIEMIMNNNANLLGGIEYHQELNVWEEIKDEIDMMQEGK